MSEKPAKPRPALSDHGRAEADARRDREAEALRENLRRRKAQVEEREKRQAEKDPA